MPNRRDELHSMLTDAAGLTDKEADGLLTLLTEGEYLKFGSYQFDPALRVVCVGCIFSGVQAVSYKPSNIVFNFKKAALSIGINAVDVGAGVDALVNGGNVILYVLLLCLKTLASMRAELSPSDAELIEFLWRERSQRRLNADDEYEPFKRHMEGQGKNPPTELEYHQSLDRLAELNTLRLEDGMILLREKVVIR